MIKLALCSFITQVKNIVKMYYSCSFFSDRTIIIQERRNAFLLYFREPFILDGQYLLLMFIDGVSPFQIKDYNISSLKKVHEFLKSIQYEMFIDMNLIL